MLTRPDPSRPAVISPAPATPHTSRASGFPDARPGQDADQRYDAQAGMTACGSIGWRELVPAGARDPQAIALQLRVAPSSARNPTLGICRIHAERFGGPDAVALEPVAFVVR
jgi:hypothetical protein